MLVARPRWTQSAASAVRLLHSSRCHSFSSAASSTAATPAAPSHSSSASLSLPPPPPPGRLRRVVVTGLGCVTPLGCGADLLFSRLMAGHTGVAPIVDPAITKLDLAPRVAAWIRAGSDEQAGQFDVAKWVPRSVLSQTSPFIHFAMGAASMALQDARYDLTPSNLPPGRDAETASDRTGVCMGSGIGCVEESAEAGRALANKGKKGLSAYSIPKLLVNLAAGQISQCTALFLL